jgi:hypothetical protein
LINGTDHGAERDVGFVAGQRLPWAGAAVFSIATVPYVKELPESGKAEWRSK